MANLKKHKVILRFKNDDFIAQLEKLLLETGAVKVTNLGIFEIRCFKGKEGYNVHTKKIENFPAWNKVVFKPTKSLKDSIQKYGR